MGWGAQPSFQCDVTANPSSVIRRAAALAEGCRGEMGGNFFFLEGGLIGHVMKSPLLNSYFHSLTELYGVCINAQ